MIEKELLKLPVADLVPYENNPRVISPEAVNACAESMSSAAHLTPSRWTKTMSSSAVTPAASL